MNTPAPRRQPFMNAPSQRWRSQASWLAAALTLVLIIASGSPWRAAAAAAADAPLPEISQPLTDLAGVVDAASARQIEQLSRALLAASGDVVVVVTVPSYAPYADIREYATKLFENHGRGIGNNATAKEHDSGVLIVVAIQERQVRIEVGYGLEQWVTDGFAAQTSREVMAPSFRNGDYGAGLVNGMARVVGRIAQGRNVTLTDVQVPRARQQSRSGAGIPLWVIVVAFLVILMMSRSGGGPGRGVRRWGQRGGWSGWSSGVGPFGGGFGGGGWGGGGGGGFGGGFGGFGGGRSGGGGGGAGW
jgi:uncharacterized protein